MALFGRQVLLTLSNEDGQGKAFPGFRVVFDVKMSTSSTPNTAVIEAYNLNPASVALAQEPSSVIELSVGYDVPRLIFRGNPTKDGVRSERRGVDRVLHIEAQDGGRAFKEARVNVSFSTSTTLQQVTDEIARQMGLPTGTLRIPGGVTFPHGITLTGPARDVLDRLASSYASEWYIRDGALQFLGAGEDTGEQAILFSADSGNLIGSPTKKDDGVEVTGLLTPSLRPGKPFRVQSRDINGDFTATDVSFRGDSGWDRPFYVVAVGKPRG